MERWRKFANSLRLRAAMRLSAVDDTGARRRGGGRGGAGVFTSQRGQRDA
jgi:hypothetical protein